jgi:hypothetical protein
MPFTEDRKVFMSSSSRNRNGNGPAPVGRIFQARKMNHLKDDVYREMLLLEMDRPGSEMGLALALLRAVVQSDSLSDLQNFREWLKTVCPLGLRMIEGSLAEGLKCNQDTT